MLRCPSKTRTLQASNFHWIYLVAFDLLDWRLLDRALLAAQVPLALRNQIMSWHHEIHYVLTHLGQTAQVCARKGL